MNKQALKYYNVTEADYRKWCQENNLPHYLTSSKRKYFEFLQKKKK